MKPRPAPISPPDLLFSGMLTRSSSALKRTPATNRSTRSRRRRCARAIRRRSRPFRANAGRRRSPRPAPSRSGARSHVDAAARTRCRRATFVAEHEQIEIEFARRVANRRRRATEFAFELLERDEQRLGREPVARFERDDRVDEVARVRRTVDRTRAPQRRRANRTVANARSRSMLSRTMPIESPRFEPMPTRINIARDAVAHVRPRRCASQVVNRHRLWHTPNPF